MKTLHFIIFYVVHLLFVVLVSAVVFFISKLANIPLENWQALVIGFAYHFFGSPISDYWKNKRLKSYERALKDPDDV